jgi:hypothetical protein
MSPLLDLRRRFDRAQQRAFDDAAAVGAAERQLEQPLRVRHYSDDASRLVADALRLTQPTVIGADVGPAVQFACFEISTIRSMHSGTESLLVSRVRRGSAQSSNWRF